MTAPHDAQERGFVLLAYGDDGFQLAAAVDDFGAAVGALERTELAPERSTDGGVIERAALALASVPLFGGRHLLVLRQPLKAAGRSGGAIERLTGLVARVGPGAALALVEERPSRDAGKASASLQRLAESVAAAGGRVVERNAPRRKELAQWIAAHAARIGVEIDRRAAALLADRLGGTAWESDIERGEQTRRADSELRKLATFAGARRVEAGDVERLVADARPASLFAVTNALERRDPAAASDALARALADGQPPLLIMATLQGRISDLIVARDLMARRAPAEQLVRRLGRPARSVARLTEAARRYSGVELEAMLRGLLVADVKIKTNAIDPASALTSWLGKHLAGVAVRRNPDAGRRNG